jgi:hypothetical protein
MNDAFEQRIRAAAEAGWRVVLVALTFLIVQWLVFLAVMATKPECLKSLWGPGIDWPFVQNVWFWAIVEIKVFVWLLALCVLGLTLWARQLRKAAH